MKFSMDKKTTSGASSTNNSPREFSSSEMMGVLGNRDQYVCNQIRAIRANLSNVSGAVFHTTLVSKSDNNFWSRSRRRRMFGQSTHEADEQGGGETDTLQKRPDYTSTLADEGGGGADDDPQVPPPPRAATAAGRLEHGDEFEEVGRAPERGRRARCAYGAVTPGARWGGKVALPPGAPASMSAAALMMVVTMLICRSCRHCRHFRRCCRRRRCRCRCAPWRARGGCT